MNVNEAQEIIKDYEVVIAKGTEGETVLRRTSWLPHSKGMIKYAYFIFLEEAVKNKSLNNEIKERLVSDYSLLKSFIDDQLADKYVKIYKDWQAKKLDPARNKKDERLIKQYLAYTYALKDSQLIDEINDFITEIGRNSKKKH